MGPCLSALLLFGLLGAPAWAKKQPTKLPPDKVLGRSLYMANCWQCHGKAGEGDGPLAQHLQAPLESVAVPWQGDERAAAVDLIQQGRGEMPAFSQVIDRYDTERVLTWLTAVAGGEDPDAAVDEDDRDKDEDKPPRLRRPPRPGPEGEPDEEAEADDAPEDGEDPQPDEQDQ